MKKVKYKTQYSIFNFKLLNIKGAIPIIEKRAYLFSIIYFSGIFLLLQSCNWNNKTTEKDCTPLVDTVISKLRAESKFIKPYTGYDTIVLKHKQTGNIANFYGQGIDSGYNNFSSQWKNWDECNDYEIEKKEYIQIKFVSPEYTEPLYFRRGGGVYDNYVTSTEAYVNFHKLIYKGKPKCFLTGDNPNCIESIVINGKQYFNVILFIETNNARDTVYYSEEFGLLKLVAEGKIGTFERLP